MGYDRLTPEEAAWLAAHPFAAIKIENAKHIALSKTAELFHEGKRNTVADAYRHCLWSALMARDIGEAKAREFSTWHESKTGNPFSEWQMDLHNNRVGLEIGSRAPWSDNGNVEIARRCAEAIPRLRVIR